MAKAKVEFSLQSIQTNPVTKKQLEGFIEEIVISKTKIKLENEALRDIRIEAKDSLGIPPRVLMKLVKEKMNAGSIEEEVKELEEVKQLADAIGMTS